MRLKTAEVLKIEKVPLGALYTSTVSRNVILAVGNRRDSSSGLFKKYMWLNKVHVYYLEPHFVSLSSKSIT